MTILTSGSLVADIIAPNLPHIGPPGSLTYAPDGIHLHPGGHAANVSIDLAQLGAKDIHTVAAVGDDLFGEFFRERLSAYGILIHLETVKANTAKNIALIVNDQDRRFIAELTANALLTPDYLLKTIKDTKPCTFYQGTIGGLKHIDPNLHKILLEVHKQGSLNIVDVIPPTYGWSHMDKAFRHIDILHCTKEQASDMTGLERPEEALPYFIDRGVQLPIITDGPNGLHAGTSRSSIQMPSFQVTQVDSTGAGDALCASLAYQTTKLKIKPSDLSHLSNESITEILLHAQAAGASCVTATGATTAVTPEKIKTLLATQGERVLEQTVVR